MQHYRDVVQDRSGNVIGGAIVTVIDHSSGQSAPLYSDANGSIPLTSVITDTNGTFSFYVASGRYDITISKNGIVLSSVSDVFITVTADYPTAMDSATAQAGTSTTPQTVSASVLKAGAQANGVTAFATYGDIPSNFVGVCRVGNIVYAGDGTTIIKSGTTNASEIITGTLDVARLPTLTKAMVGLSNVDNTSDLSKPASTATLAAQAAAEAARDAALIQAGVYTTEALGRAAVADGQAFKVQGSGDVAAYEYRRTNSTTSVLIATYPASSAVTAVTNKTVGIGATYRTFTGDGTTLTCYLQKDSSDEQLYRQDWQGRGLLSTSPRTNRQRLSEDFTGWTKATGVTVTADTTVAPDGTTTADTIDMTTASISTGLYRAAGAAVIGQTSTYWIYLKGSVAGQQLQMWDLNGTGFVNITLTTSWVQYSLTVTHTGITNGIWLQKNNATIFYAWGAEVKNGTTFSPYIQNLTTSDITITDYSFDTTNNKITFGYAPAIGALIKWQNTLGGDFDSQTFGTVTASSTAKTTPIDADSIGVSDSTSTNILRKLTWANLKATLLTYFNGQYIKLAQSGELTSDIFKISDASTKVIVGTTTGSGGVSGHNMVGVGYGVLVANTTGYDNVGIGTLSLRFNTTGGGHVCVGNESGYSVTDQYYVTAIGDASLKYATGGRNTALGSYSGASVTTGTDNLFLGWHAGHNQTTNSNLLIIDNKIRTSVSAELTDCLVYGVFDTSAANQWLRINGVLKLANDLQMINGARLNNVAQPTGTPLNATDLASAIALVNSLKASLTTLGLIA